jgi:hypothetical protein
MKLKNCLLFVSLAAAFACADASRPVAPAAKVAAPASSSFSIAPGKAAFLTAGIDDAIGRVLPSLGKGESVNNLRGSLQVISAALAAADSGTTADAVARARANIAAVSAEKGAGAAADLSAVSLAVDIVANAIATNSSN